MERTGCVKLPPGFRFHPTDEELVVQYLRRKVFSCPLPASIIPDISLHRFDPWDLPGMPEKERYFFTIRETKHPNGRSSNRASSSGFWRATGRDKPVFASRSNHLVGMKKSLVFYTGKSPNVRKTDWIMHEYRLAAAVPPHRKSPVTGSTLRAEDWVLCRVFRKRRSEVKVNAREGSAGDPEPSCVTEAYEVEEDDTCCSSSPSLFSSRRQ